MHSGSEEEGKRGQEISIKLREELKKRHGRKEQRKIERGGRGERQVRKKRIK